LMDTTDTPQVYAEATVVFPLIVAATFARRHHQVP
jgi:deoxyhypusine synthase